MAKTVTEHFDDCKQVQDVVANANALLNKTQKQLGECRALLETLAPYQHPMLKVAVKYRPFAENGEYTPEQLIEGQISRINALLGDRA